MAHRDRVPRLEPPLDPRPNEGERERGSFVRFRTFLFSGSERLREHARYHCREGAPHTSWTHPRGLLAPSKKQEERPRSEQQRAGGTAHAPIFDELGHFFSPEEWFRRIPQRGSGNSVLQNGTPAHPGGVSLSEGSAKKPPGACVTGTLFLSGGAPQDRARDLGRARARTAPV